MLFSKHPVTTFYYCYYGIDISIDFFKAKGERIRGYALSMNMNLLCKR